MSQFTLDPEALAEAIHNATLLPCQLSTRPSPSRLIRVSCPAASLDFISLGASLLFTGTMPKEHYTLVFVTECERRGRAFNFAVEHHEGYLGFFPPGGMLDAYTPQGYANATLTVPARLFEAAVKVLFPEIPEQVMERGAGIRVGEKEQMHLRGLLKLVMEAVEDVSEPLADTAARVQLDIDLLEAFIEALRSGCESLVPPPGLRANLRLRRLKQAREFLSDHLQESLSLTALCGEMGMSKRGVELLFQESFGIGPNAYLRHQRLHGVRRTLKAAQPITGVVKQSALAHGFWHMGHFAREYRDLFGESPSVTLSRKVCR